MTTASLCRSRVSPAGKGRGEALVPFHRWAWTLLVGKNQESGLRYATAPQVRDRNEQERVEVV